MSDLSVHIDAIHDDEAGVLCTCDYCRQDNPRCEDAPCCGCCDGGLL